MKETHLAFSLKRTQFRDGVLIPKYYDPELEQSYRLAEEAGFDLPELGELLCDGDQGSKLGNWIRRDLYGSGDIPYVRTSDISHWRIRPDFKKGVSREVYEELQVRQDVQANDLLMVAHGTYLVGAVAFVTESDAELVLQDHVFRLRCQNDAGITPQFLLAALSTSFVRRQVRSRQFSADIIDKIGNRHLGLRIPVPQDQELRDLVHSQVCLILEDQTRLLGSVKDAAQSDLRMTRERPEARFGFSVTRSQITNRTFIPKYYDPVLENDLNELEGQPDDSWVSIGTLVESGLLSANTGVEVGKMAYGTGDIPFLRTSDLTDWEIKRQVKQGLSREIYEQYANKASVQSGDILLVRDGTYLVGSSAIITETDVPALFCGGIYRLRSNDFEQLNPNALLAFLNLPIVRRQLRARQFTRDVIDTLGRRIMEVRIPSPHSKVAQDLGTRVASIINDKAIVKNNIGDTIDRLEPPLLEISAGRPSWSMR